MEICHIKSSEVQEDSCSGSPIIKGSSAHKRKFLKSEIVDDVSPVHQDPSKKKRKHLSKH